jgi:hypothetical protein
MLLGDIVAFNAIFVVVDPKFGLGVVVCFTWWRWDDVLWGAQAYLVPRTWSLGLSRGDDFELAYFVLGYDTGTITSLGA